MKPVRGFRDASRQMGRQTLRVASALTGHAALGAYSADVEADRAPGHHAVALGMAGAVFGWSAVDTATAFLYGATALLVGAALRLLPMGQVEGQRLLFAMHGPIARLAHEAAARPADAMWSFAPGLDIQGCRHAALGARLFRS
jgi:urease accessory protein